MTDLAVTDTHALLWYVSGRSRKLGRRALRLLERADAGGAAVYVPAIVLVEIAEEARKGTIRLGDGFQVWSGRLLGTGRFLFAPLSYEIILAGERLYASRERSDRLIAATAAHLGCPLITRDPEMTSSGIDIIW